jgi:hypothetical protein
MYSKMALLAAARVGQAVAVDEVELERREEALGDGIVPAVARAAQAGANAVTLEQRGVRLGGVLPRSV